MFTDMLDTYRYESHNLRRDGLRSDFEPAGLNARIRTATDLMYVQLVSGQTPKMRVKTSCTRLASREVHSDCRNLL